MATSEPSLVTESPPNAWNSIAMPCPLRADAISAVRGCHNTVSCGYTIAPVPGSFADGPGESQSSAVRRYAAFYQDELVAIEPPDRRRMVALTAAFTPMVTVGALPITAVVAAVASIVANVTARWVGLIVLAMAVVAMGYATARIAASYQDVPRRRGWRRWIPLVASVVVVAGCLAEIASGSKAPDPIMAVWFGALAWLFGMLPYAA